MSRLLDRYDLGGAAKSNIEAHTTGNMRDIVVHGGLGLFSLAITAGSLYLAIAGSTPVDHSFGGMMSVVFGGGTLFEGSALRANIKARRACRGN